MESSEIGQDWETLVSVFLYFLTAIVKVEFLEGRMGTVLCPTLIFFKVFSGLILESKGMRAA